MRSEFVKDNGTGVVVGLHDIYLSVDLQFDANNERVMLLV